MSASSQTAAQLDQDLDGSVDSTDSLGTGMAQMMTAQEPEFLIVQSAAVNEDLLVKVRDVRDMPGLGLTLTDGVRPHHPPYPCAQH